MHFSPRRHITVLVAALALTTPAVAQLQESVDSGTTAAIHRLLELTGTVYRAHLTRAEVNQLVTFYESPLGRRVTEITPVITQESMELGQRWGLTLGREVGDSLAHARVAQQDPHLD